MLAACDSISSTCRCPNYRRRSPCTATQLGFDELWREGELTVGLAIPGKRDRAHGRCGGRARDRAGPIFGVDSVDAWLAGGRELDVMMPPSDIPGGRIMGFRDAGGNHVYVMDQSTAD